MKVIAKVLLTSVLASAIFTTTACTCCSNNSGKNDAKAAEAPQTDVKKVGTEPGNYAPDFSLKDIKGQTKTLESFKGTYALLDFWGEWCYWCMKGMPDMKKYYDKYCEKIEFVGINCGDSEETWKKTVASEGLKWTNLYNGDGKELTAAYGIQGFPTKVLIDPEGKIVEVFIGESEELYNKLDKLFQ